MPSLGGIFVCFPGFYFKIKRNLNRFQNTYCISLPSLPPEGLMLPFLLCILAWARLRINLFPNLEGGLGTLQVSLQAPSLIKTGWGKRMTQGTSLMCVLSVRGVYVYAHTWWRQGCSLLAMHAQRPGTNCISTRHLPASAPWSSLFLKQILSPSQPVSKVPIPVASIRWYIQLLKKCPCSCHHPGLLLWECKRFSSPAPDTWARA